MIAYKETEPYLIRKGYSLWSDCTDASTVSYNYKTGIVETGADTTTSSLSYYYNFPSNATSTVSSQWLTVGSEWLTAGSKYWIDGYTIRYAPPDPRTQLRDIIRQRVAPIVLGTRRSMEPTNDTRELRARETLRRVLGDSEFRKFIRNGFVSVQAKSGLVYQIFPAHGMTNVYSNGEQIEKLCVVLKGQFPPTDSLIMRYLLILNDEQDFRNHAIKHTVYRKTNSRRSTLNLQKSLPELYEGIRKVA